MPPHLPLSNSSLYRAHDASKSCRRMCAHINCVSAPPWRPRRPPSPPPPSPPPAFPPTGNCSVAFRLKRLMLSSTKSCSQVASSETCSLTMVCQCWSPDVEVGDQLCKGVKSIPVKTGFKKKKSKGGDGKKRLFYFYSRQKIFFKKTNIKSKGGTLYVQKKKGQNRGTVWTCMVPHVL